MIKICKRILKLIKDLFPTPLPIGAENLDAFCKDLFETYNIPDTENYRISISTVIMQFVPEKKTGFAITRVSKRFFARHLTKIRSNETAYEYLDNQRKAQGLRQKQEKQAAEDARVAALAKPVVALNDAGVTNEAQA